MIWSSLPITAQHPSHIPTILPIRLPRRNSQYPQRDIDELRSLETSPEPALALIRTVVRQHNHSILVRLT
jgi:hypothetical protein